MKHFWERLIASDPTDTPFEALKKEALTLRKEVIQARQELLGTKELLQEKKISEALDKKSGLSEALRRYSIFDQEFSLSRDQVFEIEQDSPENVESLRKILTDLEKFRETINGLKTDIDRANNHIDLEEALARAKKVSHSVATAADTYNGIKNTKEFKKLDRKLRKSRSCINKTRRASFTKEPTREDIQSVESAIKSLLGIRAKIYVIKDAKGVKSQPKYKTLMQEVQESDQATTRSGEEREATLEERHRRLEVAVIDARKKVTQYCSNRPGLRKTEDFKELTELKELRAEVDRTNQDFIYKKENPTEESINFLQEKIVSFKEMKPKLAAIAKKYGIKCKGSQTNLKRPLENAQGTASKRQRPTDEPDNTLAVREDIQVVNPIRLVISGFATNTLRVHQTQMNLSSAQTASSSRVEELPSPSLD